MNSYAIIKRTLDFIFALILFILLVPFLLPIILILKLTGDRQAFFLQDRIGYKNQIFKCWKFATMVKGAEKIGNAEVTTVGDPRVTRIGAFLRKTKINELPQLVNILNGDMSFVGPRPVLKEANFDHYQEEAKAVIYNAKPGLTGIGSIVFRDEEEILTKIKNEGKDPRQFNYEEIYPYKGKLEIWYLENQSFWVDFKILFITAWTVIFSSSQLAFSWFKGLPLKTDALKSEFDRSQKIKIGISFGVLALALLLPLIPLPIKWDNFQFLIFAALPLFSLGYLLVFKAKKTEIQLIPSDIAWFIFLAFGLLSLIKSNDIPLSLFHWAIWFCFIVWMLLFRSPTMQEVINTYMPKVFFVFAIVLVLHSLFFILLMSLPFEIVVNLQDRKFDILAQYIDFPRRAIVMNDSYGWSKIFGSNANFTSSFVLTLFPFILFTKSKDKWGRYVKVITSLITIYLVYTSGARGSVLALLILGFYYFFSKHSKIIIMAYSGLASMIFFNVVSEYFTGYSLMSGTDTSYKLMNIEAKIHLIISSVMLFFENPVFGVGLGNWFHNIYKYDVSNVFPFNLPTEFFRVNSHNIYFRLLSEIGAIGLISFLYPILYILKKGFYSSATLTDFQKAAFGAVLTYLVTSFFYGASNFSFDFFSRIQLIAFCALGILTYQPNGQYTANNLMKYTLLALSVFSFVYITNCTYHKYKYQNFLNSSGFVDNEHPFFQDHNEIEKTLISSNPQLRIRVAQHYISTNQYEKANKVFKEAIVVFPFSADLKFEYAKFLMMSKLEKENTIIALLEDIHSQQNTHIKTNIYLCQYALESENLEKAKYYFGNILISKTDDLAASLIDEINSLKSKMISNNF